MRRSSIQSARLKSITDWQNTKMSLSEVPESFIAFAPFADPLKFIITLERFFAGQTFPDFGVDIHFAITTG